MLAFYRYQFMFWLPLSRLSDLLIHLKKLKIVQVIEHLHPHGRPGRKLLTGLIVTAIWRVSKQIKDLSL